jgi:hypothetical protein
MLMISGESFEENGHLIEGVRQATLRALGSEAVREYLGNDTLNGLHSAIERMYVPEYDGHVIAEPKGDSARTTDLIPIIGLDIGQSVQPAKSLLGFTPHQVNSLVSVFKSWRSDIEYPSYDDILEVNFELIKRGSPTPYARQIMLGQTGREKDSIVWTNNIRRTLAVQVFPNVANKGQQHFNELLFSGRPLVVVSDQLLRMPGRASATLVHDATHVMQLEKRPLSPYKLRDGYLYRSEFEAFHNGYRFGQAIFNDPESPFYMDSKVLRDGVVDDVRHTYEDPGRKFSPNEAMIDQFKYQSLDILNHYTNVHR